MIYKNNFVMECKQGILLTNLTSFKMARLSSDKLDTLKSMANKNNAQLSQQEVELFNALDSMGQFEHIPYDSEKDMANLLINPTIILSYECNMRCTYCYQNSEKRITAQMTEKHIDNIDSFYDTLCSRYGREKKYGTIILSGGEPCLPQNRSVIKYLLDKWSGEKIIVMTNGINLPEFINLFNDYDVEFQISLDGTQKLHEKCRKSKAGQSTYEKTLNAIQLSLDRGANVTIASLFFIDEIDEYPSFFDLLESFGWPNRENLIVKFSREMYHGADEVDGDYAHKIIDAFAKLKSIDKRAEFISIGGLIPGLASFTKGFKRYLNRKSTQKIYRCNRLRDFSYTFSPRGDVFFCNSISENSMLGSYYPNIIINENRINRLLDRNTLRMTKCTECIYKTICCGGCALSALDSGFDINEPFCGVFIDESVLDRFGEMLF